MNTTIKQDRITLKNFKIAEFASEETLCFTATVVFDGNAIGEARNEGRGGMTFIRALKDKQSQLSEAEKFAESLPPKLCPKLPLKDGKVFSIDITLDYLVDKLANVLHEERKLRTRYSRDKNKVTFINDVFLLSRRRLETNALFFSLKIMGCI
ncbi:hypothetical protein ACE08P_004440 [Salmonella enterica]|nr:hypothetical protein [Salmonella enterica subsp. arizonae]HDY3840300.1 hypothetical protein [Salmonella enterica]